MFIKTFKLFLLLSGLILFPLRTELFAHGGNEHSHSAEAVVPANKDDLLKQLLALQSGINLGVQEKKLDKLHDQTDELNKVADALSLSLLNDEQGRVKGLLANIKRASSELHKSADNKDQKDCEVKLKSLNSLIDLLKAKLAAVK